MIIIKGGKEPKSMQVLYEWEIKFLQSDGIIYDILTILQ